MKFLKMNKNKKLIRYKKLFRKTHVASDRYKKIQTLNVRTEKVANLYN
jgi:hypothetical protein